LIKISVRNHLSVNLTKTMTNEIKNKEKVKTRHRSYYCFWQSIMNLLWKFWILKFIKVDRF